MKYQQTIKIGLVLAFVLGLAFLAQTELVLTATDVEATGSGTLNATPAVSSVDFCEDGYSLATSVDPFQAYRVNFTVDTSAQMGDIKNCTIWIFDDSDHGSDYNTTSATGNNLVEFTWVESTDTWSVTDQSTFTQNWVDNVNSNDPGTGGSQTTYEFSMRFNLSYAFYACTDLNVSVHVYDDDSPTPEYDWASESGLLTLNNFFQIEYPDDAFTWGTVEQSSTNNTHDSLTINITANAAWQIRVNATDFNHSVASDEDIEGNNYLSIDRDGVSNGESQWVRNTWAIVTWTGASGWDAQSAMSNEDELERNVYLLWSPGAWTTGLWNVYVTVWIEADS